MLQENVVSKQLALHDQETTDQYVVDCKVLTVYINRGGFSIAPVAQYCSVARERVTCKKGVQTRSENDWYLLHFVFLNRILISDIKFV